MRERRQSYLAHFSTALVVTITIAGSLAWFSNWKEFAITRITADGAVSISPVEIEMFVAANLSGTYALFFSQSNFFFYPRNAVRKELLDAHPEILSLVYSHGGFQSISLLIKERVLYALWCADASGDVSQRKEETCYRLDSDGAIYARASSDDLSHALLELRGPASEMRIREDGVTEGAIGYYFLPPDAFKHTLSFRDAVLDLGLVPRALIEKERGDYELVFENGARILFNESDNFELLISNMEAAFEAESFSRNDFIEQNSSLEYLDLRFGNRVYFKK